MPRANTVAILKARSGREADLEALLLATYQASRSEPGDLRGDIGRDRATPHFRADLARIAELADRLAMVGHPVDVV